MGIGAGEIGRTIRACAMWLLASSLLIAGAAADPLPKILKSPHDAEALRRGYVGIVTGGPSGIYAALGADLLRLLDDRKGQTVRLGAMIGSGSINNLDDLWNLPGVSLAIVQGDVLSAYAAEPGQFKWLNGNVRYVSRLHTEVLHVIARRESLAGKSHDICALRGKKVNVGGLGSGARITVDRVFNGILGLNVALDPGSLAEAFDQLADGRVDALAYVVGKPAPVFADDKLAKRFAAASLDWLEAPRGLLEAGCDGKPSQAGPDVSVYEPVTLASVDYPALIRDGRAIDTIGVPAVLAAYRFDDRRSARAVSTAGFVQTFFTRAADPAIGLGRSGANFSRAWCGIDLASAVGGWRRDESAEEWLAANAKAARPLPTRIDCLTAPRSTPSFCRSKSEVVAEFTREQRAAGRGVDAGDPDFMSAFVDWNRRTCP